MNVATLSGLFLLFLPAIQAGWLRAQGKDLGPQQSIQSIHGKAFDVCVPAFAVGALMATAVFLIFPEAMHREYQRRARARPMAAGGRRVPRLTPRRPRLAAVFAASSLVPPRRRQSSRGRTTTTRGTTTIAGGFWRTMATTTKREPTRERPSSRAPGRTSSRRRDRRGAPERRPRRVRRSRPLTCPPPLPRRAKFGCSLLGGFLLPMIVSLFFPHSHDDDLDALEAHPKVAAKTEAEKLGDSTASKEVELGPAAATVTAAEEEVELGPVAATVTAAEAVPLAEEETAAGGAPAPASAAAATPAPAAPPINYRLMWTVLIGDGFHNLADGIFIGIAFLGCSSSLAWTITAVTIFHELVQELADFIILTRFCGLSVMRACVVNFLSGERTTSARDRGSGARFPLLLSL